MNQKKLIDLYKQLGYTDDQYQNMMQTYLEENTPYGLEDMVMRNALYEYGYDPSTVVPASVTQQGLDPNTAYKPEHLFLGNTLEDLLNEVNGTPVVNTSSGTNYVTPEAHAMNEQDLIKAFNSPTVWDRSALNNMLSKYGRAGVSKALFNSYSFRPDAMSSEDQDTVRLLNYLSNNM